MAQPTWTWMRTGREQAERRFSGLVWVAFALLLALGLAGCVGPGLEPPGGNKSASGNAAGTSGGFADAAAGSADAGTVPISSNVDSGAAGGGAGSGATTDSGAAETDAGSDDAGGRTR